MTVRRIEHVEPSRPRYQGDAKAQQILCAVGIHRWHTDMTLESAARELALIRMFTTTEPVLEPLPRVAP